MTNSSSDVYYQVWPAQRVGRRNLSTCGVGRCTGGMDATCVLTTLPFLIQQTEEPSTKWQNHCHSHDAHSQLRACGYGWQSISCKLGTVPSAGLGRVSNLSPEVTSSEPSIYREALGLQSTYCLPALVEGAWKQRAGNTCSSEICPQQWINTASWWVTLFLVAHFLTSSSATFDVHQTWFQLPVHDGSLLLLSDDFPGAFNCFCLSKKCSFFPVPSTHPALLVLMLGLHRVADYTWIPH